MHKIIKTKLIVILLSIGTFLLFLECVLRIMGGFSSTKIDTMPNQDNGYYTIVCLGDSYTFGIGASEDKSYPKQMETILNARSIKKRFRVINRGVSSYNTSQILNELENMLRKNIRPDLVVILGGGSNYWNYWGFSYYLKNSSFTSMVNNCIYRIRIFKLAKLLFLGVKEKNKDRLFAGKKSGYLLPDVIVHDNNGQIENSTKERTPDKPYYVQEGFFYKRQQKYEKAIQCFKKGIEVNPGDSQCYTGLGWVYASQKKYAEAAGWFKKSIELSPKDPDCYFGMGIITYENKEGYEKAVDYVKRGIEIGPKDLNLFYTFCFTLRYKDRVIFLNELIRENLVSKDYFDIDDYLVLKYMKNEERFNEKIEEWTTSDLENIITTCKNNGVKILLLNYPMYTPAPLVSRTLYKIAKNNCIPFVDNERIFSELLRKGAPLDDYFSPDLHCNAKGYNIMAINIINKIVQEKMFVF